MKNYSIFAIVFFFVIYVLLASNNLSADAYAYAYSATSGKELIFPHHLLYNPFCYLVVRLFAFLSIEPIRILQTMNALFSCLSLFVLRLILKNLNKAEFHIFSSILFVGSSFAIMRFATDNECYVIPLFFSMLALLFLQKSHLAKKQQDIILCGSSLAIGCLFHQIVILQWLCICTYLLLIKTKRFFIIFFTISLIVPLIYWIFSFAVNQTWSIKSLIVFILNDYISGVADPPSVSSILKLAPVSLFRTFFQMHGYVIILFKEHIVLYSTIILITIALCILALINIIKFRHKDIIKTYDKSFRIIIWAILLTNICFALISNANSEFMVALPFVTIILYNLYLHSNKVIVFLSCAMLIWNISFGSLPNRDKDLKSYHKIVEFIKQNPNNIYLLSFKPEVENELLYLYNTNANNIYYSIRFNADMQRQIMKQNKTIYTDWFDESFVYSRQNMIENNNDPKLNKFFANTIITDSITFQSKTGTKKLHKVTLLYKEN